ncbi:MAG TPA: histidine kinase dimerization/phospho-acceptor domain-containing protein, partial [Longimicrobium sp.]|nr:histidine kinase dimerization/phospho-acceptor domain-containing protein [Longimicrobium sp.]
ERWGADAVPFPGEVYRQYIKDCYQQNLFCQGKMEVGGERVYTVVLRDTTEARNAVVVQEKLLLAVTQATEARARLLRGVTHDIKNPLGAADGYAQLLEMEHAGTLLPEQVKWVAGVRRGIGGALALISDLLDLSLAESGGLPIHRERVDLVGLASEALLEHRGAAAAARGTCWCGIATHR